MDAPITELLRRIHEGDELAKEELIPAVYAELHDVARRFLRKSGSINTLQPTALLNEAYLKIFRNTTPQFSDRSHFLAYASRAMRTILVDYARARGSMKRDGGQRVTYHDGLQVQLDRTDDILQLLALDSALEALAKESPDSAQAIEFRYFGGMTAQETAEATKRSVHVIQHELRFAHAWLRRRLAGLQADGSASR